MNVLSRIKEFSQSNRPAMTNGRETITYAELWDQSERLAGYIKQILGDDKRPIVVYGHKSPKMLVAFLSCVKSGRAYVPIDISVPRKRVEAIIDAVEPLLVLHTEPFDSYKDYPTIDVCDLSGCIRSTQTITEADYVKEEDIYYIIFTSGSTGTPKGVQITYGALNRFTAWALTLGQCEKEKMRYLNQAPFSFDLSVMDLYMSLSTGSCLIALEKTVQSDYRKLFERLAVGDINIWVSTPSFAAMCMADPKFCQDLMPNMKLFLFCGETLTNKTAENLAARFPCAQIINTYGPTESTVAVTAVEITDSVNKKYNPLPVGSPKPGTEIKIFNHGKEVGSGESGEIIIIGDTVSAGYFKRPSENSKAFFTYDLNDCAMRAYRTGDKGFMQDGMLFYCGRIDLQIKLHGYRMEIEDVEENLVKVDGVTKAVAVPVYQDGKVKYLHAFCIYAKDYSSKSDAARQIKKEMAKFVPEYMIPRKIDLVASIPMTANGKVDRKKIAEDA